MKGIDLELSDYLRIVRKHWRSITAITLVAVFAAALFSLLSKPTYTATTSVFLSVKSVNTAGELNSGATYAENQVQSFARVARTPIVLQPVIDELGLAVTAEDLAKKVTASVPSNTATIDVAVVQGDPQVAADIANAIGEQVVATVQELSPPSSDGTDTVEATIIRPAAVPASPTTPKVAQNLALGLLVGLALGVGQALLRDLLNTRVRNQSDLERVTDAAVLAQVMLEAPGADGTVPTIAEPRSLRGESYRRLRTNLQFLSLAEGKNSFVVTSTVAGEGKTTTSLNMAMALAEAGKRVLLVDADLRRPRVAENLGLEGAAGLTTVLIGRASLEDVVQPYGNDQLDVLTSGPIPPNPSELLGFDAMRNLIAEASKAYDLVIFDAPPLLPVTDAAILANATGGALVVVGCNIVRSVELQGALQSLERADARVLGLVLNRLKREDEDRYGYNYVYDPEPLKLQRLHDAAGPGPSGPARRSLWATTSAG